MRYLMRCYKKVATSEQMKGNQNARKSINGSVVLRIPGIFVDAMHQAMEQEGFSWDIEKVDVLEYALNLMRRQLEAVGCPPQIRVVHLEDEESLDELDGETPQGEGH